MAEGSSEGFYPKLGLDAMGSTGFYPKLGLLFSVGFRTGFAGCVAYGDFYDILSEND